MIEQFPNAVEYGLQEPVARALQNKALALGELGKPDDEVATYSLLAERFGANKELRIQKMVVRAMFTKAMSKR